MGGIGDFFKGAVGLALAPATGGASLAATLGAAAIGGGLSYMGSRATNKANSALAQRQMDFQASQTGTAYQRAVADLRAAGLNPILAAGSPAASGSGATATMQNALGSGVNSALQTAGAAQQIMNIKADSQLKKAQKTQSNAQRDYTDMMGRNQYLSNRLLQMEVDYYKRHPNAFRYEKYGGYGKNVTDSLSKLIGGAGIGSLGANVAKKFKSKGK